MHIFPVNLSFGITNLHIIISGFSLDFTIKSILFSCNSYDSTLNGLIRKTIYSMTLMPPLVHLIDADINVSLQKQFCQYNL